MSTNMIVLLAGIILILISVLGNIKRKDSETRLLNSKLGVLLGIVGVLMVIFVSYSAQIGFTNTQLEQISTGNKLQIKGPVEAIKVISPVEKDSVNCRILTMGVYPENHEKDIWVVLRPTDDKYYPQSDHTNTSYKRDGEWQVVTRFGGDFGEAYDLIVYEADAEASALFSATIEKWKEADSYPGLTLAELPEGAKEIERIVVYLGKNCRGVF